MIIAPGMDEVNAFFRLQLILGLTTTHRNELIRSPDAPQGMAARAFISASDSVAEGLFRYLPKKAR